MRQFTLSVWACCLSLDLRCNIYAKRQHSNQ
jgi:hypothetical protein